MAWLFLLVAGLCEIGWAIGLKYTEGFTRLLPTSGTVVAMAASIQFLGLGLAPFFRFPDLQHPPELMSYLAERNIAVFSTDIDSRDFKLHKPEEVLSR